MTKEQQETLLQTIKARLEYNERGGIDLVKDEKGEWEIIEHVPKSPLIKYFTHALKISFDPYGNINP